MSSFTESPGSGGGGTSGGALETTQQSVKADLDSINTNIPAKGQATMANSLPVVLSSNQSSIPVTRPNPSIVIKNSGTITTSGSQVVVMEPCASTTLVINIKSAPTGTSPTLVWTVSEVDPIDQTTVVGSSVVGVPISAIGVLEVVFGPVLSGTVVVSWVISGASASFTGVNASLVPGPVSVGQFSANPTSISSGAASVLQVDSRGDLRNAEQFVDQFVDQQNAIAAVQIKTLPVITYTPSVFTNRGANNTLNVKTAAGVVATLSCFNTTGSVRYLLLHNTATVPVNNNVPVVSFLVPANSQIIIGSDFFTTSGIFFSSGIAFAISSTMDILTLATSTDHSTQINFY